MTRMHNPPHPGLTLRDDVLPALGISVTDAAQALGVTRPVLSRLLNGRAGVSPEMALRQEFHRQPRSVWGNFGGNERRFSPDAETGYAPKSVTR